MSTDEERRSELVEHLSELRTRLVRSIIFLVIGASAAWFLYDYLLDFLKHPMMGVMAKTQTKFLLTSFPEPFMIQMQICIVAGLILASPFIAREIWGFVAPGLTPDERRPLKWIAPLGVFLFFSGTALCYWILPVGFRWFASYVPSDAELRPSLQASILFSVKMLFAFGIAFELPVVLMLLAKIGIVKSRMLKENWRIAMVVTSVAAAIITPSSDAFSMLMMAIPLAGLYFLSIWLVWIVESEFNIRDIWAKLRRRTSRGR
ncbi:MAG: twin-arginine translocase subunit TatC [Armatimonadetes bacterium]|nr:twin-arginine translocase subunit TatC [Armatimonadota bacterium]